MQQFESVYLDALLQIEPELFALSDVTDLCWLLDWTYKILAW